jgi:NAD(P)-dependent dehydrogenase (short-subunit alcohol dehydrogenase family)
VGWKARHLGDLAGRTAVVTGANSGIGLQTACRLAEHGVSVVLACRNAGSAKAAAARVRGDARAAQLDLASMASVREFGESWEGRLDILVNNAGVMAPPKFVTTQDGFELQFGTNHLGHYVLTGLLLPALALAPAGRVVTVSSITHHNATAAVLDANADGPYNPQRTYAHSKLANLLFADELQRRLRERQLPITSAAAHPGVTATGLMSDRQGMGANPVLRVLSPVALRVLTQRARAGARAVVFAATEAEAGSYTGPTLLAETRGPIGAARRSTAAQDARLGRRLWHVSEELTGFRYTWPEAAGH